MLRIKQWITYLLGIFMLFACDAGPDATQPTEATPLPPQPVVEEAPVALDTVVLGHGQARDMAVAYVVQRANVTAPDGEWSMHDQTPEGLVGSESFLYTNGPWVVQVSAPMVAPEYLVYTITIDQMSAIFRWEGTVNANGVVMESSFVQGVLPATPNVTEEQSWIGVVVGNPEGAQFDDYFQMVDQNGTRSGIQGAGAVIDDQIASYRDTGTSIRVWGVFQSDVPDAYGTQILVTRVEPY